VRLTTLVVFGAGYVMGSKAGQERYAQIVAMAEKASRRLEEYSARTADGVDRDPGWTEAAR
jgi:hypothetical protein